MGNEETSPANFIKHFQIGIVCNYNSQSLRDAVNYLSDSEIQKGMRQRAAKIAQSFSDRGINQWIWDSLDKGEPSDLKFEQLMSYLPVDNIAKS